ncbi:hypothetical protein N7478_009123 [Penicillium angulare]|uniref:uncharacterized protein n=1 Tax=Penicillium angulare TaxID=116970 RepID=UPI00253F8309|nr:uncharacterized protein N7478_009123 [Penicillium angulare]KAJ5273998.1 hypothetical protein N7478_009123 [Penicillium angulare]
MASERQDIPACMIGSACRFTGNASSPSKLWTLLRDPKPAASKVPALEGYYHESALYHGHANVKEAYLLAEDAAHRKFDAAFFGIKPSEANVMDPQMRLLLETVYEALEDSGQTIHELRGSDTAVYVGQMVNDYELIMYRDHENLGRYHATGTSRAMLSNRVSYFFDWHGPSMTIDTACSSSLVALHHAVQQLQAGHSRVAVIAGSNLIYDAGTFIAETNLQMLSPKGQSRMWDASADGYARGEGVAAIVLKMRDTAEADGDNIECIIRGTAINQDGRTPGQTMPSATAQTQLMRDCYARAGLDLRNAAERPQYFECHGTGTPAGDPIEAEAISTTFFPNKESVHEPLCVGSIKTVVGHTEGTAGIAGLLKASLALQNEQIPPNLLFETLNSRIEPFYGSLHVPTVLTQWPSIASGCPRRASVNSFGFGGTNAHAILESYIRPAKLQLGQHNPFASTVYIPFVFSAFSETSLKSYLVLFMDYLRQKKTTHELRDIAYSLDARRTRFQVSSTISASTADELCANIEKKLELSRDDSDYRVGVRDMHQAAEHRKPRVLGVFTGQGAQWAQMGRELITTSAVARSILGGLQKRLDQLPDTDRPTWSLVQELEKDASCSRVMEATFAQPLCTAIQILQVDLLRAAGIQFNAAVGHSSGEIAAAYAASLISAEDAICIAYYRGLHSSLEKEIDQKPGAMMAVATSAEDAAELLKFSEFEGRACVAAINSATSVTISGDQDALEEMKVIFEDEGRQVKFLKVNKAYHSHHMIECSVKYLESLGALNIQVGPGSQTTWFSSVYESGLKDFSLLEGPYWVDNMVKPVLFMQAVEGACVAIGDFDLSIELGPHPALKGPALQTIGEKLSQIIPYTGLFKRGVSAITSLSEGLGCSWTHLGQGAVNLQNYDKFISNNLSSKLIKGLPGYAWNHESEYWHETRYARAMRMRPDPVHDLLGHLTPNSTDQDMQWRHFLRLSELKWLDGHKLQNLVVFPAAGYIVSVVEAAMLLCKNASVTLIEILDVDIGSALVFENDDISIEVILSLTDISRRENKAIETNFKYHATSGKDNDSLKLKASGRMRIHLGEASRTALPPRPKRQPNLIPVSEESFYESTLEFGYQYSGPFASLENIKRKLGAATGSISMTELSSCLIHPGALDAAFQSTFLTYAAPEDGSSKSMYIPRRIQRLAFNPDLCTHAKNDRTALDFHSTQPIGFPHVNMLCDIDIFPGNLGNAMICVQGLECVPFPRLTARDDREAFSNVVWDVLEPDVQALTWSHSQSSEPLELPSLLERVAGSYLRKFEKEVPENHPSRHEGPYRGLLQYSSTVSQTAQVDCEYDTPETLAAMCEPYVDSVDMKLVLECGKNLKDIVLGEMPTNPVSALMKEWYKNGSGLQPFFSCLAQIMKQIVHRYPQMHILEVGPEVGTATDIILAEIGPKFASYTITASTDVLLGPQKAFPDSYKEKVSTKLLDLSKNPREQGFAERSFDVIVASLILHQSPDFEKALKNARRLLKPGGYIVVLELRPSLPDFLRVVFSASSHQSLNAEEGRASSPAITLLEWDTLLHKAGFSGVDTNTVENIDTDVPFCVFASQATDDKIAFLRDPLLTQLPASSAETALRSFDLVGVELPPQAVILSLVDLDTSVFKELDETKWGTLKKIASHTGTLVWVTRGRLADNPHANMVLGIVRSAIRENPTLDSLLLEIEDSQRVQHTVIAEAILRHKVSSQWRELEDANFTVENELVLDRKGRLLIPRLMMNDEMNDRYNSNLREIRRSAHSGTDNIGISMSKSGWDVALEPCVSRQLRITHSLLSPIRLANSGCVYLGLGIDTVSGEKKMALSSENVSFPCPLPELSISVNISPGSEARFLWLTAHYLIASTILKGLSQGDKVLIHEPSLELSKAVTDKAAFLGVKVICITTNNEAPSNWVTLHPFASQRTVSRIADEDCSVFVDMVPHGESKFVRDLIMATLPAYCRKENLGSLFGPHSWIPSSPQVEEIHKSLFKAVSWASDMLDTCQSEHMATVAIDVVHETGNQREPFTIIRWDIASEVPVKIQPVDRLVLLSNKKTYWLVGLAGGLGLSLCEWMVQRGARHFVISSRNPNVERAWLDDMHTKGVQVKVSPCDLTQKDQVEGVYADISSSMPVIGGVCQGAMILEDTAIRNMTLDQFLRATKPKVDGSLFLNDIFQENTLDFFILFSSVSSVIGNPGQANYSAANTFMSSIAEQRRQRGLAGSIIDLGFVVGVGHATQTNRDNGVGRLTLRTGGYIPTSERDLHQLFGEAVLAGKPGSSGPIELVSGLQKISRRAEERPVWEAWPRMSHFIEDPEEDKSMSSSGVDANIPIKTRLTEARNRGEVLKIVWDAFVRKLQSVFQIDTTGSTNAELGAMQLDQMGIDSLTAIEISSWLMKTCAVNIPVLEILNGSSVDGLVDTATDMIPSHLTPKIERCSAAEPNSERPTPSEDVSSSSDGATNSPFESAQMDPSDAGSSSDQECVTTTHSKPKILKSVPVSFTQARFYPAGLSLKDKVGFNHIAWARVVGEINPNRLQRALYSLTQQHEILRTAFFDQGQKQMQHIMDTSPICLEYKKIQDDNEASEMADFIQKTHVYDIARGETMRMILLSRSATVNFLIMGLHPLILDATSIQAYLRWLSFHYTSHDTVPRVKQFAESSEQRHADYILGKFEPELKFWRNEFKTPIEVLPLLSLSIVKERPELTALRNTRSSLTIDVETKQRIFEICRHLRATPFHFYLAALRVLLLRYTAHSDKNEDVTIAVAENGRSYNTEEMDVLGPLYNIVLVRLLAQQSTRFETLLEATRDKTYAALANSKLPYPVLVKELGSQHVTEDYPFVHVFADYRTGQSTSMKFGENNELIMMDYDFNVPYDVSLDTIDNPGGECIHYFLLRSDLFGRDEADRLARSYKSLILAFAQLPAMTLGQADMSDLS